MTVTFDRDAWMQEHQNHLNVIRLRLSNERVRMEVAKTDREVEWRKHNIAQIEKELRGHIAFLEKRGIAIPAPIPDDTEMTDDELLAALFD
jgi:hypothetical protein